MPESQERDDALPSAVPVGTKPLGPAPKQNHETRDDPQGPDTVNEQPRPNPLATAPLETDVKQGLSQFRTGHLDPAALVVTYDDIHGLYGGVRLTVFGDGRIASKVVPPDGKLGTLKQRLDIDEVRSLVDLLLAVEAWRQTTLDRELAQDEGRATLEIAVGDSRSVIWEFYNEMGTNRRLARVRDLMVKVVTKNHPN